MMPKAYVQSGFTLIEVLLAVSITVIVAVMSYQGLDSALKLAERSEVEADRLQQLNRVFDIVAKDLRQVVPRRVRKADSNGFEHAFFYQPLSTPMLGFTRTGWTNPLPERFQRSQLQRVNYHFDGEKLSRYSWQMLDRFDDSKVTEIELLKNVESFQLQLLYLAVKVQPQAQNGNAKAQGNGKSQWTDKWPSLADGDSDASAALPLAVEVQIEIKGWGEIKRLFEIVDAELQP